MYGGMIKISKFEKKIRWYIENIDSIYNIEDLELIKLAEFDKTGRLKFNMEEKSKIKLPKKKPKPIKYRDINEFAREMGNL